jgi:hypothetical protein
VRVRVQGSEVVERTYVDTGGAVAPQLEDAFPDVEGLFDVVRSALLAGAFEVRVEYHPELGAPVDLWIDYQENVADEELGIRVVGSIEAGAASP